MTGDITIAIVGAGWRTDFFLRVAEALPSFAVCGVVARNEDRAAAISDEWGVRCVSDIDALLSAQAPDFVISSVDRESMPGVVLDLVRRGLPVLAETPPAPDLPGLVALFEEVERLEGRVQVAEQYWAQPMHYARAALVSAGHLGTVSEVHVSVCHGYHGMSLIRRLLGVDFEPATIEAHRFRSGILAGPDRGGPPSDPCVVDAVTDFAWLDFGSRLGIFDFTAQQYWNPIRSQRVCVRGSHGEIVDERVTFMRDERTPVRVDLMRHEAGPRGNLEGHHLKGVQFLDEWVYRNPFAGARLSDEEIAVATCLRRMADYVAGGEPFYSLAHACQDHYLALVCEEACARGERITTQGQVWAR